MVQNAHPDRETKVRFQIGQADLIATIAALGFVPPERLADVATRLRPGLDLAAALISEKLVSAPTLATIGLERYERATFDEGVVLIDPKAVALADSKSLVRRRFLPLAVSSNGVHVAVAELLDPRRIEEIRQAVTGARAILPELWPAAELRDAIEASLDKKIRLETVLRSAVHSNAEATIEMATGASTAARMAPLRPAFELRKRASDASIISEGPRRLWLEAGVQLLNAILIQALTEAASGIWLSSVPGGAELRFRRDSVLGEPLFVPEGLLRELDMVLELEAKGTNQIEFRLGATAGMMEISRIGQGEDASVQSKQVRHLAVRPLLQDVWPIARLAMTDQATKAAKRIAARPRGLTIVASPPGQGRSTLMTTLGRLAIGDARPAALIAQSHEFIDDRFQFCPYTSDDELVGVIDSLTREKVDFLLVDDVTGENGWAAVVDASLRGVRVFATMAARDVGAALGRLTGFGVSQSQQCQALSGIISQVLVPSLCLACKKSRPLSAGERKLFAEPPAEVAKAVGCTECDGMGIVGRLPITEGLVFDRLTVEMVEKGSLMADLLTSSKDRWATPVLHACGLQRVAAGEVDLATLARHIDVVGNQ